MKNILIIYSDIILSFIFKRKINQYPNEILFAKDAQMAIDLLKSYPIELIIIELTLAKMDAAELIAQISSLSPTTKIAFFLPKETSVITQKLNQQLQSLRSLYFVCQPNSSKDLPYFFSNAVLTVAKFQALPVENLFPGDFLQLLTYLQKTCEVEIINKNSQKKAQIYFENGVLYDAKFSSITDQTKELLSAYLSPSLNLAHTELEATYAMQDLFNWKQIKIQFLSFDKKNTSRTIYTSVAEMIKNLALSK